MLKKSFDKSFPEMSIQKKTYFVSLPLEEFILKIQDKVKDHKPDLWEKMDPKYLELASISVNEKLLLVKRNYNILARKFQSTGIIKAELHDNGNQTKIIVNYFPDTGGLKFFTWLIAIIFTLVFIPIILLSPSIATAVIYILIQIGLMIVRFISIQESELDLQHYFSRILRELTR
ncbi:MAG: hypothetical protein J0L67_16470 [Cytophagales bacterium]|nr:hypothetical protein [Cytophagales bacterium]